MVRRSRGRKRVVGTEASAPVLPLPNQRLNLDFVHDEMESARRFRVLDIVDDVTTVWVPDTQISGRRVVFELAKLIAERGKLRMIVSDNGTALTINSVPAWCGQIGSEWHCVAPGRPMQNGFCEVESATSCSARRWPRRWPMHSAYALLGGTTSLHTRKGAESP